MKQPIDRYFIFERIEVDDKGCWLWLGSIASHGYGICGSRPRKYAHRVAYELWCGPIPEGKQIDHLCRNRRCVNPYHLEAVSQRENILRGMGTSAQHARKTHCIHGHAFTPENTWSGRGRQCRACARIRMRKRYRRVK